MVQNRPGATITVAYTSASAVSAAGVSAQCYRIRVAANSACHVAVGSTTATTSDAFLPANWVDDFDITPGQKVSAIRASSAGLITATDGTLFVTELI